MQGEENGQQLKPAIGSSANLALAIGCGSKALIVTGLDGIIRRATCPMPRGLARIAPEIRGHHIASLFAREDQAFVRQALRKLGETDQVSMTNIPVHIQDQANEPVYLTVANLSGTRPDTTLLSWRLASHPDSSLLENKDPDSRLWQRIRSLESRAEARRKATARAQRALKAVAETNHGLTRALEVSGEFREQQARMLRQAIAVRDVLIERTKALHESEVEARKATEATRARLSFLADATRALSESLDIDTTLQRIASMIVPGMAECCIIDLFEGDDETLKQAFVACDNPGIQEHIARYPVTRIQDTVISDPLRHAIFTGHPDVAHSFDSDATFSEDESGGYLAHAAEIGLTACIVAPLRSRDRTFGALTLASTRPEYRYKPEDMRFIEDLSLRAAQALENAMLFHDVQEAGADRDRYLSMASHELRSPLAVVSGFGSLLMRYINEPEPDSEKIATVGKEMLHGIERIEMLISNLLTSASVQASILVEQRQSVHLRQLLERTVDRMNMTLHADQTERVHLDCPDTIYGTWNADAIERAVANVLSNALKYSPDDSVVSITACQVDQAAAITVRDEGIGMSVAEIADLFTPFARGETARQTASGTGLGLYITNQIIRQSGGRIDVVSEPGQGSTFTLHMPLEQSAI